MLKVVLFTNSKRGIGILNELKREKYIIQAIFFHKTIKKNILEKIKNDFNIPTFEKTNDSLKQIESYESDLFIVAGFPEIFDKKFLTIPKYGVINLHAGFLPNYRGGSPLNWQIINGEKNLGVSLIKMNERIDLGNILIKKKFRLKDSETIYHAHKKANRLFERNINSAIKMLLNGNKGEKQTTKKGTYYHQRSDLDGEINWNQEKLKIVNFIRAISEPYPGAYTFFQNKKVRIYEVEKTEMSIKGTIGRVFYIQKEGPFVICSNGALYIKSYKSEDNKAIKSGFFKNSNGS